MSDKKGFRMGGIVPKSTGPVELLIHNDCFTPREAFVALTESAKINKKLAYRVVRASSIEDLEKNVNDMIGQGYTPIGGMAIVTSGEWADTYAQAMTKEAVD
jgi:hypothetical protein